MRQSIKNAAAGAAIGASMLIPGVSGGAAAVTLGIYDKLVTAAGTAFKNFKKSLAFLLPVALGGLFGVILFAKPLETLLERRFILMMGLFGGAVAGSLPLLLHRAIPTKSAKNLALAALYIAIGAAIARALAFLPASLFDGASPLYLFAAGLLLSVGLVLPGVSFSQLLLALGLHAAFLKAVAEFDVRFLSALLLGIIAGTLLCVKILERAMNACPRGTFSIISGFVAMSLADVFAARVLPLSPAYGELLPAALLFVAGALAVYAAGKFFSRK